MSILFVDDDELRTLPLREGLVQVGGFEVSFTASPIEAVKEFEENFSKYEMTIVDIMMPHYDEAEYKEFALAGHFPNNYDGWYTGLKVIEKLLRVCSSRNMSTPIVVLTCVEDVEKYLDAMKLKVARVLHKPIYLSDFLREVRDVIKSTSKE